MRVEKVPTDVDEYITNFVPSIQLLLIQIRATIQAAAPCADEVISYRMPAYKYHGMLLYFVAHKNHIGLYPYPSAMMAFAAEIAAYKGAKGSLHFQFDQPLPLDLISAIVKFRVTENEEKVAKKKK